MPTSKPASEQLPVFAQAEDPTYTRLHVTPLDPELLKTILPASTLLPLARNVSFHSIETFPEKRYGFIELPDLQADKLRKKLHGATLKGHKMRVEKARRKREVVSDAVDMVDAENPADETAMKEKKRKGRQGGADGEKASKKRKKDRNVVDGVMLEEGRKVKRGWTITDEEAKKEKRESKKKDTKMKKRQKSVYTDKEECLMKIIVPPNAPVLKDAGKKKHKKGRSARQIAVHEFEHTTKFPTFLKDSSAKSALAGTSKEPAEKDAASDGDSSSSSGSSSTSEDSADEMPAPSAKLSLQKKDTKTTAGTAKAGEDAESPPSSPTRPGSARPKSSGSVRSLTIKIPPPLTPADKIHPLEALYKRKKAGEGANEVPTVVEPFSFFGGDAGDVAADSERGTGPSKASLPPMTPYSREDFDWRNIRSAAPTPDTAHPSKRVFWAPNDDDDVDEEEIEEEEQLRRAGEDETETKEQAPDSDFRKTFYEKRRELGQSWVERRKTAQKEKKTRERKLRSSKA